VRFPQAPANQDDFASGPAVLANKRTAGEWFDPQQVKREVLTDWPGICSGPLAVRSVAEAPETAAMELKTLFCSLQSANVSGETLLCAYPGGCSQSMINSPGCAKGSGRNKTPSTNLKMALLTPIPIARTVTATAAKPGVRRKYYR
jgi:hypothetical protein